MNYGRTPSEQSQNMKVTNRFMQLLRFSSSSGFFLCGTKNCATHTIPISYKTEWEYRTSHFILATVFRIYTSYSSNLHFGVMFGNIS